MKRDLILGGMLVILITIMLAACSSSYRTVGDRTKCGCPSVK